MWDCRQKFKKISGCWNIISLFNCEVRNETQRKAHSSPTAYCPKRHDSCLCICTPRSGRHTKSFKYGSCPSPWGTGTFLKMCTLVLQEDTAGKQFTKTMAVLSYFFLKKKKIVSLDRKKQCKKISFLKCRNRSIINLHLHHRLKERVWEDHFLYRH